MHFDVIRVYRDSRGVRRGPAGACLDPSFSPDGYVAGLQSAPIVEKRNSLGGRGRHIARTEAPGVNAWATADPDLPDREQCDG
jgi:hypothetical protein